MLLTPNDSPIYKGKNDILVELVKKSVKTVNFQLVVIIHLTTAVHWLNKE